MARDTTDRLSHLPSEILCFILEVVRTCIRASVLYLNFDSQRWFQDHFKDIGYFDLPIELWYFIEKVMKSKNGSYPNRLRLHAGDFQNRKFYKLLRSVGERNVKKLDLIVQWGFYRNVSRNFPRILKETLEKVRVEFNCFCKVPNFTSFSRIKRLHLVGIVFPGDFYAATLFSSNALLVEDLHLQTCDMSQFKFIIISLCNLRYVTFANMWDNTWWSDYVFSGVMIICAPKLLSFNYIGPKLRGYALQNQLSLDKVIIRRLFYKTCLKDFPLLMPSLVKDLGNAKPFTLSALFVKYLSPVLGGSIYVSTYLRCLKLEMKCTINHVEGLLTLLKLCPYVEEIVIYFKLGVYDWAPSYGVEDVECRLDHLKVVKIFNFSSQPLEVEFIRFLFLNAKVLGSCRLITAFPTQDVVITYPGIRNRESIALEFEDEDSDVDD